MNASPRDLKMLDVVNGLVTCDHWPDVSFVRLPLIYPSGSMVTVEVHPLPGGSEYRVTDGGFGFQELEDIGAERSFTRTATPIASESIVNRNGRAFFIDVPISQLSRAIADVGKASWQLVERVYANRRDESGDDVVEYLADRLRIIFGDDIEPNATLIGASTTDWEMSVVVRRLGKIIAFQAVSSHANSVYRANAAFDDLSALDDPPQLVAIVPSFEALGPKLTLLSRSAKVLEEGQSNDDYLRAAA